MDQQRTNLELDYNPSNPLPDLSPIPEFRKQGIERYLDAEAASMPTLDYPENSSTAVLRDRAMIVVFNVSRRENFEPFIPYLAMNYFDRYISRKKEIPKMRKHVQNDLELLSLCCLTLACKMRGKIFTTPRYLALNQESKVITPWEFLKMEVEIVKTLDWHMRPVTACCFVRFFEPYFHSTYGFRRKTINEIIIQAHDDFSMSRVRPSVIAASALLAASVFLYPDGFESFVEKICSLTIFKEEEVLRCMRKLIDVCMDLRILIESAVPENEYLPKMKVRAGETSAAEISESTAAGTTKIWKEITLAPPEQVSQGTAEPSSGAAAVKLKQVAPASLEQATAKIAEKSTEERTQMDIERSQEMTFELSEHPIVASTEQVTVGQSAESTEEPKHEGTEKLEVAATESSEQLTVVPTKQVVAQKSEESTEEPERWEEAASESSEQSVTSTEQVTAEKRKESIQEPKQVAGERSEKEPTELSGQQSVAPTEQVAAKKESIGDPKQMVTGSLELEATQISEQVAIEKSKESVKEPKQMSIGSSKEEPTQLSKKAAAQESKQAAAESSQQPKAVSTEQVSSEKSKESTEDSRHEIAEALEKPTYEESKQVSLSRIAEFIAQESTQAAIERSKEVTTESSQQSSAEAASPSSKGKEKEVELVEKPKTTVQESTQTATERSKEVAAELVEHSTTEGTPISASASSQWKNKGKEIMKETTEIPRMAADGEDTVFDFVLRWRPGVMNEEDNFVIVTPTSELQGPHVQVPRAPVGRNQAPRVGGNKAPRTDLNDFCCFCNCDACFNRCSPL